MSSPGRAETMEEDVVGTERVLSHREYVTCSRCGTVVERYARGAGSGGCARRRIGVALSLRRLPASLWRTASRICLRTISRYPRESLSAAREHRHHPAMCCPRGIGAAIEVRHACDSDTSPSRTVLAARARVLERHYRELRDDLLRQSHHYGLLQPSAVWRPPVDIHETATLALDQDGTGGHPRR